MSTIRHIAIDVFDYNRNKLCSLYDSSIAAIGQAHDITLVDKLGDSPSLTFEMPYIVEGTQNFRWNFIKAEYLVRLTIDDKKDWFILDHPKKTRGGKGTYNNVSCSHLSMQLKTRNLYMVFDDTNGIGTLPDLMRRALTGTQWSFDETHSDVFYENDDPDTANTNESNTVKVRSIESDNKKGAYQLITDICTLFDAYPIFDGENRTVTCYSKNHFGPMRELHIGKNINSLDVKYDSSSIITRLYVEGTFDDDNYLGIDTVHPYGLSYIQDFSYYEELGLYTQEHADATQQYYEDMRDITEIIRQNYQTLLDLQNALNSLWGQPDGVYYPIVESGGTYSLDTDNAVLFGNATAEDIAVSEGDVFIIGEQAEEEGGQNTFRDVEAPLALGAGDIWAVKFLTLPSANVGALQVSIDTKKQLLSGAYEDLEKEQAYEFANADKIAAYNEQIATYQAQIADYYNGTTVTDEYGQELTTAGLYERMESAVTTMLAADNMLNQYVENSQRQDTIEATYAQAMGDMLREGYWNNSDYVEGQEQTLYNDALEMMAIMCRPKVTYSFDYVSLAEEMREAEGELKLNMQMHVYDRELGVNDILHISKLTMCLDNPSKDNVEISNEDVNLTGGTLDSVLGRMTQLADLIDQKQAIYKRAGAINSDGSLYVDRLNGQINILQNRLLSSRSNWYTDDNGSMIFEASSGRSAMMLTGEGFMIANGRKQDGTWNWRT